MKYNIVRFFLFFCSIVIVGGIIGWLIPGRQFAGIAVACVAIAVVFSALTGSPHEDDDDA